LPVTATAKTVATFKVAVSASLTRRFLSDVNLFKKIPVVAAALDPRHKQLKLCSVPLRMATREHTQFPLEQQGGETAPCHDSSLFCSDYWHCHSPTSIAETL